ncbi:hypothetical protein [Nocardiopsis nanhaiensis]
MPPSPAAPFVRVTSPARRVLALCAATLFALLCAAPAHAESADTDPGPEEGVGAAEHYAGLLTSEPEGEAVVVDESLAGDYDLADLEQSLHGAFGQLDTPYYVIASDFPSVRTPARDFLAALQDRVDQPGLYVYLRPQGTSVYSVARDVDAPAEEAATMLTREGVVTTYTPVDTKADAFVDMLRDPGLEERYASRAGSGWYVLGPVAWWAENHVNALRLNTADGPARLGATAAFAVGLTVTLGLVFGGVRYGRRKRSAEAGYTGKLPGERALFGGQVLVPAVGLAIMAGALIHVNNATLPRDEQQVGPLPPATPPYAAATPRTEQVSEELRADPLYVDPLAEQSVQELEAAAERAAERADDLDLPVYTAVVPLSRFDEVGGDPETFAHALHHVMDEDGVFVVVDGAPAGSLRMEAALFGAAVEGEENEWEQGRALREVTGHLPDLTTGEALDALVDVLADVSAAPGEVAPEPSLAASRAEPAPETSPLSEFTSGGFLPALFIAGPVAALPILALMWAAARAATRMRAVPGRSLRPEADRAVRRASKALLTAPEIHPGRAEALRETDAALAVLAGQPDELDLVGVVVLADRAARRLDPDTGTSALADAPVCRVNPLHGPSVLHGDDREQPLCASCCASSDRERERRTLKVAALGGGRLPHLELERRWTTTGYGAKGGLDLEDLLKESDAH